MSRKKIGVTQLAPGTPSWLEDPFQLAPGSSLLAPGYSRLATRCSQLALRLSQQVLRLCQLFLRPCQLAMRPFQGSQGQLCAPSS